MLKKISGFFAAFFLTVFSLAAAEQPPNFFPPAGDRSAWQAILATPQGKARAEQFIQWAEAILNEPVPALPAEVIMRFRRKWNRTDYENLYFQRRKNFNTLVLAECFEYKGRFVDKIIDYIWAITEEHFWNLPAHYRNYYSPDPLPFKKPERIALFSSATGMDLTVMLNLLKPELEKISPNLIRLVHRELDERIIEPLELRPFPFDFIRATNNWRPWCIRNCMVTVMYRLYDQPQRQQKIVDLFKQSMKEYMVDYSDDGCCDEGPGYWAKNPALIMQFYDLIKEKPGDFKKFVLMGEYIIHTQLTDKYFVNFGDTGALQTLPVGDCYRYGEVTGNENLKRFALTAPRSKSQPTCLYDELCNIFWRPAVKSVPKMSADSFKYYQRLQILMLKHRGIALAAKRGFRGSHYHMDIGQFILYYRNEPVIIDLGNAVYTAATFSQERFQNWILHAEAHNVPQFNGVVQLESPKPDVQAAAMYRDDKKCVFKLDLTSAYPAEAQLEKCERIITYSFVDQSLEVEDKWQLKRDNNRIRIPLYTPKEVISDGKEYRIGTMQMSASGNVDKITVTPMTMDDARVIYQWGKKINRIDVVSVSGKTGSCKMRFVPAQTKK